MTPLRTTSRSLVVALAVAALHGMLGSAPAWADSDPTAAAKADPRWSLVYVLEGQAQAPAPPSRIVEYGSLVPRMMLPPTNSPDVAVKPTSNHTQSEISVAIHPTNKNIVFVGANATDWPVTQVLGTGTYWSTDAGATWNGSDNGPGGVGNRGDPAAAIRALDNRWLMGYISPSGGMGVSFTTNGGSTWTHRTVSSMSSLDKNHLHVDNKPSSPFYGRVYNAWVNLGGGPSVNDIDFSRSTDGGDTWSAPTDISAGVASGSHDQGVNIRTGPNGEVYACWAIYDSFPADETAIGFNKSTNGGVSWTGEFRAITSIRGHRNTSLPNTSIRRNSFPAMAVDVSGGSRNGWIYIVWTNIGVPGINTGNAEIYMARSTNGGTSFDTPVRVNQDATTRSQWFPWISCDPVSGQLAVTFYDRRDDPADTQARAYLAISNDGGVTWEDFPVADVSFTPVPIPGLAGGYMGDYLGVDMTNGLAIPGWCDNRSGNFLCYVSPINVSDPTDPNPPTNATAFSDYTTPTSVALNWTDPTTHVNGTPLPNFSIDILRNDVFLVNVDQGVQSFVDGSLTDGTLYSYTLKTHDDVTDSLSIPVGLTAYAGGSPIPAAPTGAACVADTVSATISWTNPTRQTDGTKLDDFAGLRIFRNGAQVIELARTQADTGSADSYVDHPPTGFVYSYEVAAIDNEIPVHESAKANAGVCFVGNVPRILVWSPPGIASTGVDSIFTALSMLGESVFETDNLFEFAPDLNVHEIVFVPLGIFADNHVLTVPEGSALDSFVQDGGRLYVEGGDCFNYDTTYNIRPIFGLNAGGDGSADLFDVTGINDLAGFQFNYTGGNNYIDELAPATSTPILKNTNNADIVGVFNPSYGAGSGRAIGASFEFGGLVDVPSQMALAPATHDASSRVFPDGIVGDVMRVGTSAAKEAVRIRDAAQRKPHAVVKRWANLDAPTAKRVERIPGGMAGALHALRSANTKLDLMAAYLALFRATGDPVLSTSTTSITSTVYEGATDTKFFSISNPGSLNDPLTWTVTETPDQPWLTVAPLGGTIPANGSTQLTVGLDATALGPGVYEADLVVNANDPVNPSDTVHVTFNVNGVPVVQAAPSPLNVYLQPSSTTTGQITLSNGGDGNLDYTLTTQVDGGASRFELASQLNASTPSAVFRGDVYRIDTAIPLKKIEMRMNIGAPMSMEFFVYENTAPTGTFTKIFSKTVTSGTGLGWHGSGGINVSLVAGKYYFIGAGWPNFATIYYDFGATPPLPFATPFGAVTGAGQGGGYPPAASAVLGFLPFLYSMALEYGDTFNLALLDPAAGTLPPSGSTILDLQVTSLALTGVFNGSLKVASNDPSTPFLTVPIIATVNASVDAPAVEKPLPTVIALHANVPNPFRNGTEIRFDLPRAGRVQLRIYDVSGRLVRTLVDREEPAGYRSVVWDGKDETGQRASAGVYFYSFQTQDKTIQRKMVQLR